MPLKIEAKKVIIGAVVLIMANRWVLLKALIAPVLIGEIRSLIDVMALCRHGCDYRAPSFVCYQTPDIYRRIVDFIAIKVAKNTRVAIRPGQSGADACGILPCI